MQICARMSDVGIVEIAIDKSKVEKDAYGCGLGLDQRLKRL